jgi:IS30 family transposase
MRGLGRMMICIALTVWFPHPYHPWSKGVDQDDPPRYSRMKSVRPS